MYQLYYAACTHQGRIRQNNEDNFLVDGIFRHDVNVPQAECSGKVSGGYLMASVCDGMGGEEMGEVASLIAVQTLAEFCAGGKAGGAAMQTGSEGMAAGNMAVPAGSVSGAAGNAGMYAGPAGMAAGSAAMYAGPSGMAAGYGAGSSSAQAGTMASGTGRRGLVPLGADYMSYVNKANGRICRQMRKIGSRMGSTASLLEFTDGKVMMLNLGDSRVFRLRDGELTQLSTDHTTIARLLSEGILTPEQAAVHPKRHQITQYLGIFPEEMILEPSVLSGMELKPRDRYLLSSDGLTDMVSADDIREILGQDEQPLILARRLMQAAVRAGGRDNVTVVVVMAETDGRRPVRQLMRNCAPLQ